MRFLSNKNPQISNPLGHLKRVNKCICNGLLKVRRRPRDFQKTNQLTWENPRIFLMMDVMHLPQIVLSRLKWAYPIMHSKRECTSWKTMLYQRIRSPWKPWSIKAGWFTLTDQPIVLLWCIRKSVVSGASQQTYIWTRIERSKLLNSESTSPRILKET